MRGCSPYKWKLMLRLLPSLGPGGLCSWHLELVCFVIWGWSTWEAPGKLSATLSWAVDSDWPFLSAAVTQLAPVSLPALPWSSARVEPWKLSGLHSAAFGVSQGSLAGLGQARVPPMRSSTLPLSIQYTKFTPRLVPGILGGNASRVLDRTWARNPSSHDFPMLKQSSGSRAWKNGQTVAIPLRPFLTQTQVAAMGCSLFSGCLDPKPCRHI